MLTKTLVVIVIVAVGATGIFFKLQQGIASWRRLRATRPRRLEQNAEVRSGFSDYWVPRIGEQAAIELRRSSLILIVVAPLDIVLAMVASFTLPSRDSAVVLLGVVAVIVAVIAFAYWLRSRSLLANAIGDHLGFPVRWLELPRMRGDSFDRWSQRKRAGVRLRSGIHRT